MNGISMEGLGRGMMGGLEMFRRHQAEDEDRAQRKEAHDLSMEATRYNLDTAKQDRPLQRRALERADAQGGRDEWIAEMADMANKALARAQAGDLNAINEFSLQAIGDPDLAPMVMPAEDEEAIKQGMVMFGPPGQQQLTPLRDVFQYVAKAGSPDAWREKLMQDQEGSYSGVMRDDTIGSFQIGPDGQVHQLKELEPGSGSGAGGFGGYNKDTLSYYRQKADTFWGSRNADGQFIIPPEARNQREVAEQRMRELEAAGLPPQASARYGNFSVIPPLNEKEARKMAAKEAAAAGLTDTWRDDDEFDQYVQRAVPELIKDSRRAHEIYKAMTGGGLDSYLDKMFEEEQSAGGINMTGAPAAPAGTSSAGPDLGQMSTEELMNAL